MIKNDLRDRTIYVYFASPAPTLRINSHGLTSFIATDEFDVAGGMTGVSGNWEATTCSESFADRRGGGRGRPEAPWCLP